MRKYLVRISVFLMFFLFLGGCARKYRLHDSIDEELVAWPFHRGDIRSTGYVNSNTFSGYLKRIWKKGRPGKPAGPLTIYYGNIMYPSAKGRVRVIGLQDGSYRGRLQTKGTVITGVVVSDSIAVYAFAPRKNQVLALNLRSGNKLWKRKVKDITPGSILIDERYFVGSSGGTVFALNVSTGEIDWKYEINQPLIAPFTADQDVLFVPGNKGRLFALTIEDGKKIWQADLAGPLVSAVAVSEMIVATSMMGEVYALNPIDGSIVWQKTVGGPVWTAPAVADGRVFVGNSQGQLFALDLQTGKNLWEFERPEVIRAAPTIVGNYLLVGTMTGSLYSLDVTDGSIRDKVLLEGGIVQTPISDGRLIVVATDDGNLTCFGSNDAEQEQDDQRVNLREGY